MAADAGLDPLDFLSKAWYNLRLSVRCPSRVPTWDAIIITAASSEQAELYQLHLEKAKWRQRIESSTVALAVSDPQGRRIGSGGATLFAIRSLAEHLASNKPEGQTCHPRNGEASDKTTIHGLLLNMRILLVHAGGDSKRIPWANPMGKAFLPLPFLSEDEPDGPVPSLFDHILAISSTAVLNFKNRGGLFIMTGDVLPCFDFSALNLPEHGASVVTVPATLDVATNHGVIATSSLIEKGNLVQGLPCLDQSDLKLDLVMNLLQKPSAKQLKHSGILTSEGKALLDTGIFAVLGKAWRDLISLALEDPDPVLELLTNGEEMSLYEELAGAWVPARHEWLEMRPLGKKLVNSLSSQKLYSYCARDLSFLHFGTSVEVLNHLAMDHGGRVGRRHLNFFTGNTCNISPSAVILSSDIDSTVSIGEHSLVFGCTLPHGVHIGSQCITVGVHFSQNRVGIIFQQGFTEIPLKLPDGHCLWEVPLCGTENQVTLCCGIEDNPKALLSKGGTFCGKPWMKFICSNNLQEKDLWPFLKKEKHDLWNAKVFPVLSPGQGIHFAMWLMGVYEEDCSSEFIRLWHACERVSLAELHGRIDFKKLFQQCSEHYSKLALKLMRATLGSGLLDRNLARLCAEIIDEDISHGESCNELLALCPNPKTARNLKCSSLSQVPLSRIYQAQADICRLYKEDMAALSLENDVWHAVAAETAIAVGHKNVESLGVMPFIHAEPCLKFCIRKSRVELPVRVDIVGGWSDTPPWSLERIGTVLNMAICFSGSSPVGAEITATSGAGILITDDMGNCLFIEDPKSICTPFRVDDPFRLVKSALLVSGIATSSARWSGGLEVKTWAHVPCGSGLGTSSILAAAVVKGLLQVMGADDSNENVASLVLVLEQLMGTGGGWQDQIGGLYPGIKCTTSIPGQPLKLRVDPIIISSQLKKELEERMLVVFTGQVRLAHQVLQNVVRRYVQHDSLLITTINRLVQLASIGRQSLTAGNLEKLGRIMSEAWMLHQELDPYCSNTFVDKIFRDVADLTDGYKLVGAGGGGFALLMAKSREAAIKLTEVLEGLESVKVYKWSLCA
eukprot:c25460_g1_i1 orf=161-3376(+)